MEVIDALFLEEEGAGNVRQDVLRLALVRPKADAFQRFRRMIGAPTRTRTADLLITNQLLYQLSYRGTVWANLVSSARFA